MLALAVALVSSSDAAANESAELKTEPAGAKSWTIRWKPAKLVNGAPIAFQVTPSAPVQSLSGKWLEHEIFFVFDPKSKTWYGIAGVSLETRPGSYPLALEGATASGETISFQRRLMVSRARYPTIRLAVSKQFTEPSAAQLEEIARDKALKAEVFSRTTPEREWAGRFLPPVKAPISDVFGTRRIFNGEVQSTHQGLDYGVPRGKPVSALNRGTVLLARPLFFEGNCVVLDHGQGLLSLYLHLSEIRVKEGERVERGQEIGLSGASGRATGPHLHVAVRWQGVYLNPATLMKLRLP